MPLLVLPSLKDQGVGMRVVDVYSGCGGLGLGARNAGFDVPLSIDADAILTSSHHLNFRKGRLKLADVAGISGDNIVREVGARVDGLIGGPPCQGFSEVGLADPADPRRGLLGHFFRLVREIRPRFFVMENVRGLMFDKNRATLDEAIDLVRGRYRIVGPVRLDSAEFGAATKRPRVFVIGFDAEDVDVLTLGDLERAKRSPATVRQAIGDIANSRANGRDDAGFDLWTYGRGRPSSYAESMRSAAGWFTSQRRIPHRSDVSARFAEVVPGAIDKIGRHPRLHWDRQCPTIRAGTGADRGSFQAVRPIHPEEPRVITVREAARLQGFPDSFLFHPTVWHSFRMIGNSVSPVMAHALLSLIATRMGLATRLEAAE